MTKQNTEVKTFEESIKELENIVSKLESNEVSLDESIQLFTNGMKMVSECNEKLSETQKHIELITEKNGEIEIKNANLK